MARHSAARQMVDGQAIVARAERIAEELLFPATLEVARTGVLPVGHLDALAEAGLYGLAGPPDAGGLGADLATFTAVVETLASGCLTTTFTWAQHHGAVRTVAQSTPAIRSKWLVPLCRGTARAGVAFGSLRREGPPLMTARAVGGAWLFAGTAPWVTGWGLIDVVHVAARTDDDRVVWALIEPLTGPTLSATRLELAAVDASATVQLELDGHVVPAERVTLVEKYDEWRRRDAASLRPNGSLALGAARRCAELLRAGGGDDTTILEAVDVARRALDAAGVEELAGARARATLVALDAATALVVRRGGSAVTVDDHAQRLCREAMFLLVFGQTGGIRASQLATVRSRLDAASGAD